MHTSGESSNYNQIRIRSNTTVNSKYGSNIFTIEEETQEVQVPKNSPIVKQSPDAAKEPEITPILDEQIMDVAHDMAFLYTSRMVRKIKRQVHEIQVSQQMGRNTVRKTDHDYQVYIQGLIEHRKHEMFKEVMARGIKK